MATRTTAAASFREAFTGEVSDPIFRNNFPFAYFPSRAASGDTEEWVHKTAAGSGGTFVEGGAFAAAENNTYVKPQVSRGHFQETYSVTEDLEATMAIGSARVFDAIALEAEAALLGVFDQATGQMLGATAGTGGIRLAISNTGTYATLAHNTTTGWDSRQTAVGGALTIAMLQNDLEALMDAERLRAGWAPNLLLASPTQVTNYLQLAGPGASTSLIRYIRTGGGNGNAMPANVGDERELAMFGNIPIVAVPDLTNTVWLMTVFQNHYIAYWNPKGAVNGLLAQDIPKSGHQTETNLAMTCELITRRPFHAAQDTGVSA